MITSLTVTFDRVVSVDAGTFELRGRAGRVVPLKVSFAVVDGRTVVTLMFRPGAVEGARRWPTAITPSR